jgi:hypothetical protein
MQKKDTLQYAQENLSSQFGFGKKWSKDFGY